MGLINWTLLEVMKRGFTPLTTPEIVRSSIVEKCGFQPRGANTQVSSRIPFSYSAWNKMLSYLLLNINRSILSRIVINASSGLQRFLLGEFIWILLLLHRCYPWNMWQFPIASVLRQALLVQHQGKLWAHYISFVVSDLTFSLQFIWTSITFLIYFTILNY